jgi:hypothetical protein
MNARPLLAPPNLRLDTEQLIRIALAAVLGTLALFYFWFGRQGSQLYDFGSFWASGRAALDGLNPYAVYPQTFNPPGTDTYHPNLNPPASLLLFAPLAWLDPGVTIKVQWWLGLSAYAGFVGFTLHRNPRPNAMLLGAWALALPAFWDGIRMGQVYVPMMIATAVAWHLMERDRPLAAAIVIGCLTALKPNLLVWPALLFIAGHRRMGLTAGLAFAVASLLPLLFFETGVYAQWFEMLAGDLGGRSGYFANATVMAIGVRAGSHMLGLALALVVLAWSIRRLWGARLSVTETSAIALGVAVLVSPVAWMHYLLLLLPALLRMRWNRGIAIAAAALAVPMPALFWIFKILPPHYPALAEAIRATVGSAYSWAALLLVISIARLSLDAARDR